MRLPQNKYNNKYMNTSTKKGHWIALLLFFTCALSNAPLSFAQDDTLSALNLPERPNILWLVVEDMSPIIPAYGDNTIETPAISALAEEGVKYTNVYSTSGVCAPSRAALALGMYPSSIGANHMRTTSNTEDTGLPAYEAVPPAQAKMLSQYLREHGYYTTNNQKTDYQFQAPKAAWDESSPYAHWRNRPENKPFFSVFNFTTTHESGLFEPYGIRQIEFRHYFSDDAERISNLPHNFSAKTTEQETPQHLPKDTDFSIPPYLPDTPVVRRDMWKMYNNLAETDRQIGAIIQQLKDDDLYEDTIIFFYADHGGPLPRQKRLIYDSGLKVPMVIKFPKAQNAGTEDDQLVSFIDFSPATLALAGLDEPAHMHGRDFILSSDQPRKYIHAAADRFDGLTDVIRATKNQRYKYIRNYRPEQGYYLPVVYRERIPTMQELLRLKKAGELNEYQAQWFRESKPVEELFDTIADPHELNNIAENPEYKEILDELSQELDRWLADIGDMPNLPERQLINQLWQGSEQQPITSAPEVHMSDGVVSIQSETNGASIAYKIIKNKESPESWAVYQGPFKAESGTEIRTVAHRIGYQESSEITHLVE